MADWADYIPRLMIDGVGDAAIFGKTGGCWAAHQQGKFKNIAAADIVAAQGDRSKLLAEGLRLGNRKYTLVQDKVESDGWMGLKSKSSAEDELRYSAVIFLTAQTVTIVEAKAADITIQKLLDVIPTITFLKDSGY
ncbi:profilin-1-like [Scyliorhinus torazame]|uniref:profilin-1-like n=1 Tax=Scyliorhinus torazame TaxID=75743 RepID=UPI003B5A1806